MLKILPGQLGRDDDVETRAPGLEELRDAVKQELLELLDFVFTAGTANTPPCFKNLERGLRERVRTVARMLVVLFLCACERRVADALGEVAEVDGRRYRRRPAQPRNLMTLFGVVRYWRTYVRGPRTRGGRSGFHPTDALLGLTTDRLSIGVASLGAYLSTKMSFAQARECLARTTGDAPSTETIERSVLGLGAHADAYFEQAPAPDDDGDVLVIQIDGKGVPTATAEELERRRGPRPENPLRGSARHRGRARRGTWNRKRRHPGEAKDPRKNAKVAMVLVMYTLRRTDDGLLRGPINKRVWASFGGKKEIFAIARREAIKRGFDPASESEFPGHKLIHIVTDGDDDLATNAATSFPHAVQTIDVMHVLEYVWHAGRAIHSDEQRLRSWARTQKHRLLHGQLDKVVGELDRVLERSGLPKAKRAIIARSRNYILERSDKLDYQWLRDQDLDIGTGAVEGAVNHIVALRFDHGGMRWIRERAQALLTLRCTVFNGDWDRFIDFVHEKLHASARHGVIMPLLRESAKPLPNSQKAA